MHFRSWFGLLGSDDEVRMDDLDDIVLLHASYVALYDEHGSSDAFIGGFVGLGMRLLEVGLKSGRAYGLDSQL